MPVLQGVLAERDAWSAVGQCSIEKTMAVAGTKSAMLIMREAYYGTTRFDDFARRVGITKAATSARLAELVGAGLLTMRGSTITPTDLAMDCARWTTPPAAPSTRPCSTTAAPSNPWA